MDRTGSAVVSLVSIWESYQLPWHLTVAVCVSDAFVLPHAIVPAPHGTVVIGSVNRPSRDGIVPCHAGPARLSNPCWRGTARLSLIQCSSISTTVPQTVPWATLRMHSVWCMPQHVHERASLCSKWHGQMYCA